MSSKSRHKELSVAVVKGLVLAKTKKRVPTLDFVMQYITRFYPHELTSSDLYVELDLLVSDSLVDTYLNKSSGYVCYKLSKHGIKLAQSYGEPFQSILDNFFTKKSKVSEDVSSENLSPPEMKASRNSTAKARHKRRSSFIEDEDTVELSTNLAASNSITQSEAHNQSGNSIDEIFDSVLSQETKAKCIPSETSLTSKEPAVNKSKNKKSSKNDLELSLSIPNNYSFIDDLKSSSESVGRLSSTPHQSKTSQRKNAKIGDRKATSTPNECSFSNSLHDSVDSNKCSTDISTPVKLPIKKSPLRKKGSKMRLMDSSSVQGQQWIQLVVDVIKQLDSQDRKSNSRYRLSLIEKQLTAPVNRERYKELLEEADLDINFLDDCEKKVTIVKRALLTACATPECCVETVNGYYSIIKSAQTTTTSLTNSEENEKEPSVKSNAKLSVTVSDEEIQSGHSLSHSGPQLVPDKWLSVDIESEPPASPSTSINSSKTTASKKIMLKKTAKKIPVCSFCLGDDTLNTKTKKKEPMVACNDCGICGHPTCLQWPPSLYEKVRTLRWQCLTCKKCSLCGYNNKPNEDLLLCDACDRGFHMHCCDPPLLEPPSGTWLCNICEPGRIHPRESIFDDEQSFVNYQVAKKSISTVEGPSSDSGNKVLQDGLTPFFTPMDKRKSQVSKHLSSDFVVTGLWKRVGRQRKRLLSETKLSPEQLTENSTSVSATPPSGRPIRKSGGSPEKSVGQSAARKLINRSKKQQTVITSQQSPCNDTVAEDIVVTKKRGRKRKANLSESNSFQSIKEESNVKMITTPAAKRRKISKNPILMDGGFLEDETENVKEVGNVEDSVREMEDKLDAEEKMLLVTDFDRDLFQEIQLKIQQLVPCINEIATAPVPAIECEVAVSDEESSHLNNSSSSQNMAAPKSHIQSAPQQYTEVGRFPPCIQLGCYKIETWYSAPYPFEYARLNVLYICEFCLKYIRSAKVYLRHVEKCPSDFPPGNEIYRRENISVWEVDGYTSKLYCQNLCLLAKLFLDHKTLYYDVEPFMFYVVTFCDANACHLVGYFSKEKQSNKKYNLSCVMVLPPYQKHSYGRFLIEFSYLLSRVENQTGSPEKPLSALGQLSYDSYWRSKVLPYLVRILECQQNPERRDNTVTVAEISEATGIDPEDIAATLQKLSSVIYHRQGRPQLQFDPNTISLLADKYKARETSWIPVDEACLRWSPLIHPKEWPASPTTSEDKENGDSNSQTENNSHQQLALTSVETTDVQEEAERPTEHPSTRKRKKKVNSIESNDKNLRKATRSSASVNEDAKQSETTCDTCPTEFPAKEEVVQNKRGRKSKYVNSPGGGDANYSLPTLPSRVNTRSQSTVVSNTQDSTTTSESTEPMTQPEDDREMEVHSASKEHPSNQFEESLSSTTLTPDGAGTDSLIHEVTDNSDVTIDSGVQTLTIEIRDDSEEKTPSKCKTKRIRNSLKESPPTSSPDFELMGRRVTRPKLDSPKKSSGRTSLSRKSKEKVLDSGAFKRAFESDVDEDSNLDTFDKKIFEDNRFICEGEIVEEATLNSKKEAHSGETSKECDRISDEKRESWRGRSDLPQDVSLMLCPPPDIEDIKMKERFMEHFDSDSSASTIAALGSNATSSGDTEMCSIPLSQSPVHSHCENMVDNEVNCFVTDLVDKIVASVAVTDELEETFSDKGKNLLDVMKSSVTTGNNESDSLALPDPTDSNSSCTKVIGNDEIEIIDLNFCQDFADDPAIANLINLETNKLNLEKNEICSVDEKISQSVPDLNVKSFDSVNSDDINNSNPSVLQDVKSKTLIIDINETLSNQNDLIKIIQDCFHVEDPSDSEHSHQSLNQKETRVEDPSDSEHSHPSLNQKENRVEDPSDSEHSHPSLKQKDAQPAGDQEENLIEQSDSDIIDDEDILSVNSEHSSNQSADREESLSETQSQRSSVQSLEEDSQEPLLNISATKYSSMIENTSQSSLDYDNDSYSEDELKEESKCLDNDVIASVPQDIGDTLQTGLYHSPHSSRESFKSALEEPSGHQDQCNYQKVNDMEYIDNALINGTRTLDNTKLDGEYLSTPSDILTKTHLKPISNYLTDTISSAVNSVSSRGDMMIENCDSQVKDITYYDLDSDQNQANNQSDRFYTDLPASSGSTYCSYSYSAFESRGFAPIYTPYDYPLENSRCADNTQVMSNPYIANHYNVDNTESFIDLSENKHLL